MKNLIFLMLTVASLSAQLRPTYYDFGTRNFAPTDLDFIMATLNVTGTMQNNGVAVVTTARTITIAGTASEITSSAGAQDLSGNRTWMLSLPSAIALAGKTLSGGTFSSPTLTTPTIASFANATHSHQNAAGGGTLDGAAIAAGTVATARIDAAIARLASPALTGNPTAPTQSPGDNSTKISTTAYVDAAVAAGGGGGSAPAGTMVNVGNNIVGTIPVAADTTDTNYVPSSVQITQGTNVLAGTVTGTNIVYGGSFRGIGPIADSRVDMPDDDASAYAGLQANNTTITAVNMIFPAAPFSGLATYTVSGTTNWTPSAATANDVEAPLFAADAGANDTYVATLAPAITAYVTGAHYRFKANTANTGAATVNLNGLGAKTIKKAAGGITSDLADNDIRAGQWCDVVYDGTNMQLQSTLGNAAGGSGTVTSVGWTGGIVSVATATTTPAFTIAGTSGGIPYFNSGTTWATSAALAANALVIGGGAGAAPSTTTTGTGILTWLGTPSSANLAAALTGETGTGAAVFADSPVFATKITYPPVAGTSTLGASGETALNTTDKQIGIHNGTKEVAIPLKFTKEISFDPDAVCDGTFDGLFLFTVTSPKGITITSWRLSFEADPTTELDLDLKRADAFIGRANSAVMDVLDTTTGASSETTAANINSGAVVANGRVIYLEFGTAYTESNHQIIFEMEYEVEED